MPVDHNGINAVHDLAASWTADEAREYRGYAMPARLDPADWSPASRYRLRAWCLRVDARVQATESLYEAIWSGIDYGFGEKHLRGALAEHRATLAGLRAGSVRPSAVVGSGYRRHHVRAVAERWLREQITTAEQALATRGRSHPLNQSNVRYTLRRLAATPSP